MAIRAISADVKAANSTLAQFLRRQEEEENILQIGKRKPKQLKEERLPGGRARWLLDPDWRAPTPLVDRPRTIAGATSFHFSFISISKKAVPTVRGEPVEGTFGKARNVALDHSKYIERDGAAEVSRGADHADYIERPGAAEMLDPTALMSEVVDRTTIAVINETLLDEEAELLGLEAIAPQGIPSVFSNISDDPFERQEFWRAVERREAVPRKHEIILEPDIAPAWWRELQTTTRLPADFRDHSLKVAESYRQYLAAPVPKGEEKKGFKAEPFKVSAERAGEIIQAAQRMASYNEYAPPFEFKSGRGGRIQFRMVAELPHELTAEDRALIVQNFCDHLAQLEERRDPDGTPRRVGMMYTAVIHAPDSHNDSRNYHLHIVAYDRPARFMPEHGQWDFEVVEWYNHKGTDRPRYPHRQNKIGEVSQGTAKTHKENSGGDFIPSLRCKFAGINNAVLKARGIKRQLDPRKFTDMGIDRTPTEHMGTKAAALESIGVPTTVGQHNAIAIWSDAERAIRRQAVQSCQAYNVAQNELDRVAREMTAVDPADRLMLEFRQLVAERERLIEDVADDREAIMTFDLLEAKAKSRAKRARQTCLQFLADIERGKADRATKVMKLAIQDRWKGAQQHIESIDKALEPHRDALAKAARNIEERERRILEIDTVLTPLRATLERRLVELGQEGAGAAEGGPVAAPTPPAPQATATPRASHKGAATEAPAPCPEAETTGRVRAVEAPADRPEVAGVQAVAVEPVSIEGLPIVEPTIGPRQDIPLDEVEVEVGTPEGLEPLRPIEVEVPSIPGEQVIVPDLDDPSITGEPAPSLAPYVDDAEVAPETSKQSIGSGPQAPAPAKPNFSSETADHAPSPKSQLTSFEFEVGGRKKVADPAVVDLSAQETPIKVGTSRTAYDEFDALIVRIMNERIPIMAEKPSAGLTRFIVPTLAPAEQLLLSDKRFAHRTNQRLSAIRDKQQNEIQRVINWVQSSGRNPDMLRLDNRRASLGEKVKVVVKTLFKHWGRHPDVLAALRAENERRIELAREQTRQVQAAPVAADQEREARRAEAAELYPTPDQAFTEEVEDFIKLLRDAAPEEQLQGAADKIHASPRAREDINKHNVHLATAYRQYSEGVDQREAQRARDQSRQGR